MSNLLMEAGGRATLEQVMVKPIPLRDTSTYQPIYNDELLDMVYKVAADYGLKLVNPEYGLARNGQRMFGGVRVQAEDRLCPLSHQNQHENSQEANFRFGHRQKYLTLALNPSYNK